MIEKTLSREEESRNTRPPEDLPRGKLAGSAEPTSEEITEALVTFLDLEDGGADHGALLMCSVAYCSGSGADYSYGRWLCPLHTEICAAEESLSEAEEAVLHIERWRDLAEKESNLWLEGELSKMLGRAGQFLVDSQERRKTARRVDTTISVQLDGTARGKRKLGSLHGSSHGSSHAEAV